MYIVLEIQTSDQVATLPPIIKATKEEAYSAYYSILAAAAISQLPMHAAVLMTNEGNIIEHKAFTHQEEE